MESDIEAIINNLDLGGVVSYEILVVNDRNVLQLSRIGKHPLTQEKLRELVKKVEVLDGIARVVVTVP